MESLKGREKQIVDERLKKIELLRKEKISPYVSRFDKHEKKIFSEEVKEKFSKLKNEELSGKIVILAGRVMNKRSFGKLSFCQLQDLKGEIQLVIQKEKTPEKTVELFNRIDMGDIIGVEGEVMKTKTGQVSVLVDKLYILTKAVLPLPDKFHGIKDEEERLRKRYLDIITNPNVKELFLKKQMFFKTMRDFLIEKGFIEVETPVLETSPGGAAATPFLTHHNALDIDVYLRISMGELWQKKLLVAGYEKVFEIGRQFRNEGMDLEHLQDYSQMEFYWAYANYKDGMKLAEELYKKIALAVLGKLKFKTHGYEVDFSKKWAEVDYENFIEEKTGLNIYKAKKEEIMKFLDKIEMDYDKNVDKWRLVDLLWKYCRKQIAGPVFLTGQPVELSPLAKRREDDSRKVEQFQIIIGGSEMGNGYSELNDPLDQEERFVRQRKLGDAGDGEAMQHDKEFVEALKYGMPPAFGFGVSERFFSYLVDRPIRECVIFPLMRPQNEDPSKKKKKK